MDSLDRRILQLHQSNTRIAAESIGERVGLSAAAVLRRLKRLREEGVIAAETAALDLARLGLGFSAIVSVDLIDESAVAARAFRDATCARPEVQQCYGVTGLYDYVLMVVVADLAAYDAFCQVALLHDANVRSFSTQVVLDAAKRGGSLALG